jgi:KDO2-lipid IV(A) lauroyltransferase
MPLCTAFCYRTKPGYWRIEMGPEISTHEDGRARPLAAIMGDVNRAFEAAVRRDPANWFWVHNRWKARNKQPPTTALTDTQALTAGDPDDEA